MTETYCGKTCAECAQRETLNCPGCKAGPGRQYSGDCTLAKCCRSKGHQDCGTCSFSGHCGTLRSKDFIPEHRIKNIEAQQHRAAAMAKCAPLLGKWLWILFWLIIPNALATLMTEETIAGGIPALLIPGQILSAVCAFAYGAILVRLSPVENRYGTAGICALICGAVNVLVACLSGGGEAPTWTLLITLPAAVVAFVGEYQEYTAHSIVLTDFDDELSEKWPVLWKWYIGMYGAMLGSILIVLILPLLGLVVTLAAAIGAIVVSIFKLIYLYRTAKVFRTYPVEAES